MSDIDFSALTHQIVTTAGIMHHQTKLDVFIIRAYKLLSSGSIINSNALQSVTGSPQTTSTTPAATTTNGLSNGNGSNSMVSQNGNNSSMVNNTNGNPAGNSTNNLMQFQYSQLFVKISKLYNATISSGAIDDRSTSPKSAIELYQRFQQIIKELELSYEVSPYSRYFHRLDQGLWQIKEDAELKLDRLWELVSLSIFSIYDPRTGQMINQGRRKAGSLTASTKGSPTEMMNNTNNNNNNINTNKIQRASHSAGTGTINSTVNNMMMDESLPQQLQRRLQTIPQDINSRSLNGYYTQPTSPGQGAFAFGLDNDATLYNTNNNTNNSANNNNTSGTSWKRRSLGSLGVDALDDDAVEELLQLTNTTKRQRTATPINYNNVNAGTVGTTNTGMSTVINSTEGAANTHPMTSHSGNNSNGNNSNSNDSNNNNNNNNNSNENNHNRNHTHNNNDMSRYASSAATNNNINIDGNLNTNDNMNNALVSGEILVRQLKGTYDTLVSEKNQRINQLERELELQRQETQWLRKMLIEDMGCVRSLLKDLRR